MNVTASAFKLVLSVVVFAAVFGAINSIQTHSLEPKKDNLVDKLQELTGNSLKIYDTKGEKSHDPLTARRLMREAMVFNMLASTDCRVLAEVHAMAGTMAAINKTGGVSYHKSIHVDSMKKLSLAEEGSPQSCGDSFGTGESCPNEIKESTETRAYTGSFRSFVPLIRADQFDLSCTGAKNAIDKIKDSVKKKANPLIKLGGAAAGASLVMAIPTGGLSLAATAAGAGAAAAAGYVMGGELINVKDNFVDQPSFDMEGMFSRINFDTNQTFRMGVGNQDLLFAFNAILGNNKRNKQPGFWNAKKAAFLVPPGLDLPRITGGSVIRNDRAILSKGEVLFIAPFRYMKGENGLYSHRVRMINVPMISEKQVFKEYGDEIVFGKGPDSNFTEFLDETSYLFCKGAEGVIQSNALRMNNGGPADSSKGGNYGAKEDYIFPYVKIMHGERSCFDTSLKSNMVKKLPAGVSGECSSGVIAEEGNKKLLGSKKFESGIGGEKEIKFYCSIISEDVDFVTKKGKNVGSVPYYRPGITSNYCGKRWINRLTFNTRREEVTESGEGLNLDKFIEEYRAGPTFILKSQGVNGSSFRIQFNRAENTEDVKVSIAVDRIGNYPPTSRFRLVDYGQGVKLKEVKGVDKTLLDLETRADKYTVTWQVENWGDASVSITTAKKEKARFEGFVRKENHEDGVPTTTSINYITVDEPYGASGSQNIFLRKMEVYGRYAGCK